MTALERLEKAHQSLNRHAERHRGGRIASPALRAVDRYRDARQAVTPEEWVDYCERYGYAKSHTGYDFFA